MSVDYPAGYNIPAFPAGKSIAVARWMGIASLIAFLMIVVTCGMILWTSHSRTIDPFIVTINADTGQWHVVEHNHDKESASFTPDEMMQIYVISKFVQNWFLITPNTDDNLARWKRCTNAECTVSDEVSKNCLTATDCPIQRLYGDPECEIYCSTTPKLFEKFVTNVVPYYQLNLSDGRYWAIDPKTIRLSRMPDNVWQIRATVVTNYDKFNVLAYATIVHSDTEYTNTFGYYIENFDSYRLQ